MVARVKITPADPGCQFYISHILMKIVRLDNTNFPIYVIFDWETVDKRVLIKNGFSVEVLSLSE